MEIEVPKANEGLMKEIADSHGAALDQATSVEDKLDRQAATKAVEEEVLVKYSGPADAPEYGEYRQAAQLAFDALEKHIIRQRIAVHKKRPDGRSEREIRQITIDVKPLPRTHGSALFTRGQTQALTVVALGTTREEMRLDNLGLETSKRYFHHYNFPPFSVGEAGFMRGPKRRDIGHGALAERALVPMIPDQEKFPYTIRVVSDILESNGSSSMASICGSSLSLMDAGVPLTRPVAGIAMGLIKEGDDYVVLSDIAGVEDHLGDMDFKVAGTEKGITALQMDIKITGVTFEIMRDALEQAHEGRTFILGKMAEAIDAPREQLSEHAPRISSIQIDPEKIGLLIGKGGETIRSLQEEYESQIDVNDEGMVLVYAVTGAKGDALVERIRSMTKEVEVGDEYKGKVVKTTTFGAFVELAKGTDGLLHISNVSPGNRVGTVEEVLNKGDEIAVRVVEVDKERGRIGLRLAEDPDIAGKTKEELASVGTGDPTMGGGGGRDRAARAAAAVTATATRGGGGGDRGGRGRDRDRAPRGDRDPDRGERDIPRHPDHPTSGSRHPWPSHHGARLRAADRHGGHALRAVRGPGLLRRHRLARRGGGGGRALALPRAPAVPRHRSLRLGGDRPAVRRHGRRAQRRHGQGEHRGLRADARPAPAGGLRRDGRHGVATGVQRRRPRARGRARGDRDVRGRPAGHGLRRARRGRLRRPPARAPDHRPRAGDPRHAGRRDRRLPRAPLRARLDRDRGGRLGRPRRDRRAAPRARSRCATALEPAPAPEPAPAAPAANVRFVRKDTEQVHVTLGGLGLQRGDDRRFAARVLDAIFGGLSSLAAVPGRARGARAGLLASTRSPASTPTRARSASTSARARTTSSRR